MSDNKDGISFQYQGITITYDEPANLWRFQLRGRERSAESLAAAKRAIDAPVKEKNTFKRFQAFYDAGWRKFEVVEVTSIAEPRWGGTPCDVWCYNTKSSYGKRFKTDANRIFPMDDRNSEVIRQIKELQEQEKKISEQIEKLKPKLKAYKIPAELGDEKE